MNAVKLAMVLTFAATAACWAVKPDTKGAKPGQWTMDYEAAKKLSAEKNLPMLFNFTGSDWCPWCVILDEAVFQKKDWERFAKKNLVLVWVDFPRDKKLVPEKFVGQNNTLKTEFRVNGFPSLFVTDSSGAKKAPVARQGRGETTETFIASVNTALNEAGLTLPGADGQTAAETTAETTPKGKPALAGAEPGHWTMDYEAAKKLSAEKKLPMLINFTGSDWCGWCKLMDREVFSKKEWRDYANENLILVWIDFPRDKSLVPAAIAPKNQQLAKDFNVGGYPTYHLVGRDGETKLAKLGAKRDPTPAWFIGEIKKALAE